MRERVCSVRVCFVGALRVCNPFITLKASLSSVCEARKRAARAASPAITLRLRDAHSLLPDRRQGLGPARLPLGVRYLARGSGVMEI